MTRQVKLLPEPTPGVELLLLEARLPEAERAALERALSAEERVRRDRLKVDHVRETFITSRGLLRRLLGERLDCAPEDVVLERGRHGKPRVGGRHADSALEFNVSHSGDVVLFGFTRGVPIGVDVEEVRSRIEIEPLASRFFGPGEARELLEDVAEPERLDAFFRCWTRKEAYLKARGSGLTQALDRFEVTLRPGDPPAMRRVEVAGEDPATWCVFDVPVPAGYHAAGVVRAPRA